MEPCMGSRVDRRDGRHARLDDRMRSVRSWRAEVLVPVLGFLPWPVVGLSQFRFALLGSGTRLAIASRRPLSLGMPGAPFVRIDRVQRQHGRRATVAGARPPRG